MSTTNLFFEHPILNSPYKYPARHWELDAGGQPTQQIIEKRRRAEFITPIPKPRKRKGAAEQKEFVFNEGKGLSTLTSICRNKCRSGLQGLRYRNPSPLPNYSSAVRNLDICQQQSKGSQK